MGLFKKKPKTDEPDPIQAELASLEGRLGAAERARTDLEAQLRSIGEAYTQLTTQIATLDQANGQLDARLATLDHGFTMLGDQLGTATAANTRLDERLSAVDELDERVRELTLRLDTPISSIPAPPPDTPPPPSPPMAPAPPPHAPPDTPPPPPPAAENDRIDEMAQRLDELAAAVAAHTEQMATARVQIAEVAELDAMFDAEGDGDSSPDTAAVREQLDDLSEQLNAMDGRVTAVSTELANQLTELSRDIDQLNRRADDTNETGDSTSDDGDAADLEARLSERLDTAIDDVLETTERLAAEQARYEIQFRADLAELAERIRRPSAG